ncbi:hypothetical protein J6590_071137 [Homalodisca vitripennis]|nr:hypothetical protein J6590_071137 [Homalodisca vitripennis]
MSMAHGRKICKFGSGCGSDWKTGVFTDLAGVFTDLVSGGQPPTGDRMEQNGLPNGSSEPVNFIVGDEGDGDAAGAPITEEEKRENTDAFPSETTSNNASYKDLFGLAERRKRLR